jgi:hypothetical protein
MFGDKWCGWGGPDHPVLLISLQITSSSGVMLKTLCMVRDSYSLSEFCQLVVGALASITPDMFNKTWQSLVTAVTFAVFATVTKLRTEETSSLFEYLVILSHLDMQ